MCIGVWSLEHPDYALILCTNRDELLNRPTQNAHFHSFASSLEDDPLGSILSGRDIQAGGSWFGINRDGRVALLTNITEPASGYSTSRGSLVSSFLLSRSTHPLQDELGTIVPQDASYAGFNLLLLEPVLIEMTPARIGSIPSTSGGAAGPGTTVAVPASPGASEKRTLDLPGSPPLSSDPPTDTITPQIQYNSLFVTNHGGGRPLSSRSLVSSEKYCGCMSNSIDGADKVRWPKVIRAAADFEALLRSFTPRSDIQASEASLAEQLFGILAWYPEQSIKSLQDVRKTVQVLPIPVTSIEGQSTYFGTRLATVLLVRRDGQVLFIERVIWEVGPDGVPFRADPPKERTFQFRIELDNL